MRPPADASRPEPATPVEPIDWDLRLGSPGRRALASLERATMVFDRLLDRLVGAGRLNPLHYTGTLTTFLVLVIIVTGVYLTMFYQFGFEASYGAVDAIESRWVGRLVRAAHRYASIGAVVMTIIHAWRTFVMDRFRGARWLPWISGIGMTVLLWIAGVTGYWMIWDERAGPLNAALVRFVRSSGIGLDFLLDIVVTDAAGTGWVFLLVLFTIHLLLTGVIAWFYWYHVKRLTRRRFLPPRVWVWITGTVLAVVSILLPVGMLPPFDRTRLVESMPFDPFFLFMLEPALDWPAGLVWGGSVVALLAALAVPWLLRRRRELPAILVDAERCTGCTLCAADCPYRAIEMVPQPEGKHRQLARVDAGLCVSCGICIGSCPELAMTFGATPAEALHTDLAARLADRGEEVVFTCERHLISSRLDWNEPLDEDGREVVVIPLPCIGMAHPDLVGEAVDAGATAIRFVGCPPDDCANLEGNTWLAGRLDRSRLPRLSKQLLDVPSTAWITPGDLLAGDAPADERRNLWRAALVMGAGLVLLVAATWAMYRPSVPDAVIEVAIDHLPGAQLIGFDTAPEGGEEPHRLTVSLDGETVLAGDYPLQRADAGQSVLILEQVAVEPGTHRTRVTLQAEDGEPFVLFDDLVAYEAGQILTLHYRDQPPRADAIEGRKIFTASSIGASAGCQICHSVEPGVVLVGPSLYGIGDTAEQRVPGMGAAEYLRESIVNPDAYVVEGFPAGQMLSDFGTRLSEDEIDNLVSYLLTLRGESS